MQRDSTEMQKYQTVFAAVSSCLLATPGNHLQCLWKVFTYLLKSLTADHLT